MFWLEIIPTFFIAIEILLFLLSIKDIFSFKKDIVIQSMDSKGKKTKSIAVILLIACYGFITVGLLGLSVLCLSINKITNPYVTTLLLNNLFIIVEIILIVVQEKVFKGYIRNVKKN